MKNLKSTLPAAAALCVIIAALSCNPFMIDDSFNSSRGETQNGEKAVLNFSSGDVLAAAVSFPSGYEWRRDTLYGAVEAKVILQCNGKSVLSFDAGSGGRISAAADAHHLLDGKLYSEGRDGDSTYISLNGEAYLSFSGKEKMKGLMHMDKVPYILSQRSSGTGFVLRKDGKTVIERTEGALVGDFSDPFCGASGALFEDSGHLCFVYYRNENSSGAREWYFVEDGEESALSLPKNAATVYDARKVKGKMCYVYRNNSGKSPIFEVDGKSYDLSKSIKGLTAYNDYRIVEYNGSPAFEGTYAEQYTKATFTKIWNEKGVLATFGGECSIYSSGGKSAVIVKGKYNDLICTDGSNVTIESGVKTMNARCAEYDGGKFYMALSPTVDGRYPEIWDGKVSEDLEINGFYAAIEVLD